MTTETKFKDVEEILDTIIKQAKEGSCKTCQWCFPHETTWWRGGEKITYTHACLIQGNVNPIGFTEEVLEREPYPAKCEDGDWWDGEDHQPIYGCLSYQPDLDRVIMVMASGGNPDHPAIQEEIDHHRRFMECLAEAARIHFAIKDGKLEKLLMRLNTGDFSHFYPWE